MSRNELSDAANDIINQIEAMGESLKPQLKEISDKESSLYVERMKIMKDVIALGKSFNPDLDTEDEDNDLEYIRDSFADLALSVLPAGYETGAQYTEGGPPYWEPGDELDFWVPSTC